MQEIQDSAETIVKVNSIAAEALVPGVGRLSAAIAVAMENR